MTSCEIIRCSFFRNNKCCDPEEFMDRTDGTDICRYNDKAVPREEYEDENNQLKTI
jgi:hypothetical protein